ncbi:Predicted nucleotidyltransferase [Ruminococcus sp. YE71]|uniref:nucleotidyltransferase family protein n=1 Tax=unclassified Ruminococcus TaxID=2608920 RepID=UPI000890DEF8|nr:Predicted nucleotidyltransferase [Ruminococcus sp. YE78]SFW50428.1 Predicted nucleotidyltransferase [Ruminococcus sp. YE71]
MYNLSESIINEISAIACRYDVEKIVLFGSRAKGTNSKTSDIDLAVYGGNVAMFSLDIEEEVRTLLMFDVVDMNRVVSAELRSEIEKYGVVIYEKI